LKSWLSLAQLWYNSSFHSSLGFSPFKALHGYEPNLGLHTAQSEEAPPAVSEIIADSEAHLQLLKQKLEQAQNMMKLQAGKNQTDKQFIVGDEVLLKLQPYTQSSVASRPYPKLHASSMDLTRCLRRLVQWLISWSYLNTVAFTQSFTSLS
jgi:hypothetical protein